MNSSDAQTYQQAQAYVGNDCALGKEGNDLTVVGGQTLCHL